jgi:hypothetical protein
VIKDVALTGTGLALIVVQEFSSRPSTPLLAAGLALTGIGASFHIGKLVSGHIGGPSSGSPPGPGSSPPPEVTGE